jgi:hypothetical protein
MSFVLQRDKTAGGTKFWGSGPKPITRDEARRIASNIAKLPELLQRQQ